MKALVALLLAAALWGCTAPGASGRPNTPWALDAFGDPETQQELNHP